MMVLQQYECEDCGEGFAAPQEQYSDQYYRCEDCGHNNGDFLGTALVCLMCARQAADCDCCRLCDLVIEDCECEDDMESDDGWK